ncbi:MAG: hypothetical protein ACXVB0_13440 [Mucilaginibacter sp.]
MDSQTYQYITSSFSVGTWLQTLIFYFVLFLMFHIVLAQLNLSIVKFRLSFVQRWMAGRVQK